jgi:protein-tyrosine phosphatase
MARTEREVRTSKTHPLRIDWLGESLPHSLIGLTFAPGKRCESTLGFRWERDVDADLSALIKTGTSVLVCLMEDHELPPNGLAELLPSARSRGLEVLRLQIRDGGIPDDIADVDTLLDAIDDRVSRGQRIVIHCLGGLGRTGTVAGCYLVRRGMTSAQAIEVLHHVRKSDRCPENDTQRAFIAGYEAQLIKGGKSTEEPPIASVSESRAARAERPA